MHTDMKSRGADVAKEIPEPLPFFNPKSTDMRKLRRLPWRLPKSNKQDPSHAKTLVAPRPLPELVPPRETLNTQPVAFAGGRFVYIETPSVSCAPEVRHKARHRVVALST